METLEYTNFLIRLSVIEPVTAAIVVGTVINGIMNMISSDSSNRSNRKTQEKINADNIAAQQAANALTRQQALEDWDKTNQYNHPKQQMKRIAEAGLNPNLIYGNGAESTASMIRGTSNETAKAAPWHTNPLPMPDLTGMTGMLMQNRNAVTENELRKKQIDLANQKEARGDLEIAGIATKNAKSKFDYEQAKKLQDVTILQAEQKAQIQKEDIALKQMQQTYKPLEFNLQAEKQRLQNAKTQVEIESATADIIRKTWQNTVQNPVELKKLNQALDNMQKDGQLKQMEIELMKMGFTKNDPVYIRLLQKFADRTRAMSNGSGPRFGTQEQDQTIQNFFKE